MRVGLAGTFGPLHDGHRRLLEHAICFGEDGVVIGITSDAMATESRSRTVPPVQERRQAVRSTIEALNEPARPVEIRTITDEYGSATTDPSLDALVLSPETVDALAEINDRRRANDRQPLTGIVAPYVVADDGERISSTRVVAGEIDPSGTTGDRTNDP
jgi:pantetheine-phosphate adenylyltransferase